MTVKVSADSSPRQDLVMVERRAYHLSQQEQDPSGLSQHAPGAKLDHGKPNLDLVLGEFPRALTEVGKVGTFGANKYTPRGWLQVDNAVERYSSALLRHYLSHRKGEYVDPDSGLSHLAHMAWNALAVLELIERGNK